MACRGGSALARPAGHGLTGGERWHAQQKRAEGKGKKDKQKLRSKREGARGGRTIAVLQLLCEFLVADESIPAPVVWEVPAHRFVFEFDSAPRHPFFFLWADTVGLLRFVQTNVSLVGQTEAVGEALPLHAQHWQPRTEAEERKRGKAPY